MECLWRSSGSVGLMTLATLMREARADFNELWGIPRIDRAHEVMRHHRRDAICTWPGWALCPDSAGGGCCPNGYSCNADSCVIPTETPMSACGLANYYPCPLDSGGGCCPLGSLCGDGRDCYAPEGLPVSISCPASFFACPSTIGGCCRDGMACARGYCYETEPATYPVSSTVTTTNSRGDAVTTVITETTIITPGPGPGTSNPTQTAPIVVPSVVNKIPSVETSSSNSGGGGLTKAQLGGIIAGVVTVLVVILVAAFIIIRRLNQAEKAVAATESKRDTSDGQQKSQNKRGFGQPTVSEVDGWDVDPLMQSPRIRPSHMRSGSDDSFTERSPSRTPNIPSTSSTPPAWATEHNLAQIVEAPSEGRVQSTESSRASGGAGTYETGGRYSQAISFESRRSHSRQHSNVSELSGETVNGPGKSELYADGADGTAATAAEQAGRRRASTSAAHPPSATHGRKNSGGGIAGGSNARVRSESAAPLGTVNEFGELHGHYGPPSLAVGQTAERLVRHDSTASSVASRAAMEAAARKIKRESSVSATPTEAYRKEG